MLISVIFSSGTGLETILGILKLSFLGPPTGLTKVEKLTSTKYFIEMRTEDLCLKLFTNE